MLTHEEWLKKYGCKDKKCFWWGWPQYGGVCGSPTHCRGGPSYIKKVKQKLIDDY